MRSSIPTIAATAVVILITAGTSRAQCIVDGDFTNWSSPMKVVECGYVTTIPSWSSSGNPGTCLEVTFQTLLMGTNKARLIPIKQDATWDPATDGPITSLTLQIDTQRVLGSGQTLNVAVLQNGQYYAAPLTSVSTGSNSSWQPVTLGPYTAADFARQEDGVCPPGNQSAHPDFTTTGSLIKFGFAVGNPGNVTSITQRYDNFRLNVLGDPADLAIEVRYPEDATGELIDGEDLNALIIWQDDYQHPYPDAASNQHDPGTGSYTFSNLPAAHTYIVEAYANDMLVGYSQTPLCKDTTQVIRTPHRGSVRARVFLSDGETPLSGATVELRSHEDRLWRNGTSGSDGWVSWSGSDCAWLFPNQPPTESYLAYVIYNSQAVAGPYPFDVVEGSETVLTLITTEVCDPPTITDQPDSIAGGVVGQAASFSVGVSGTPPFTYTWYKDSAPLTLEPGRIAVASDGTLTIDPMGTSDTGVYEVVVLNDCGSTTSAPAALTIYQPGTGNVQGVVIDQSNGLPVVDATISMSTFASVQTRSSGSFRLLAIPVGTYQLTAHKTGYHDVSCSATVRSEQTTSVYLSMPPISSQEAIRLGQLSVTGASITQTGDCLWEISGGAMINNVLRCTGTLIANTCESRLRGNGQIWIDDVPLLGDILLYEGQWEFDGATALTTAINDWLSDLEVAGMKVNITKIGLNGTTARAQGYVMLPENVGGGKIDVTEDHYLEVSTAEGLVYDFTIENEIDLDVGGFTFSARDSSAYLSNVGGTSVCKIYGIYELSDFLGGITVNLDPSEDNYFLVSKSGEEVEVDVVGSIAIGEITITPGIYGRDLFLDMDTVANSYYATGVIGFPMGTTHVEVDGELEILEGYFDSASLTASFDPAYPILFSPPPPVPVVYLASVGAGVSNLSPKSQKAVVIQLSGGFQGGPDFFGYSLVELDLTGTVDLSGSVRGDAVLQLGNNAENDPIITGTATVIIDLHNGMYLAMSVVKDHEGQPFLSLRGEAVVDLYNNFASSLTGSVVVPTNVPIVGAIIGGQTVSAQAYAQAIDDTDNTNDYLAVGFVVIVNMPFVGDIEMKPVIEVNLANNQINWMGSWDRIKEVSFPGIESSGKFQLTGPTEPETFTVAPNVEYVVFRAGWETDTTELHVTTPGGQTITPANVSAFDNVKYYTNIDPKEAFYLIKQPAAGAWQLVLSEGDTIGSYTLQQLQESEKPTIAVVGPAADTSNVNVSITWTDADSDDDATISLYYDSNREGADGTLIVGEVSEDDPANSYTWNTAGTPSGQYYVYAVITDGKHTPAISYSIGRVLVSNPDAPSPPADLGVALTGATGQLALRWAASPDPDVDHYNVYYTSDAAGEGMEAVVGGGSGEDIILTGLQAGERYRIAIASVDDTNNIGPLSQPVLATLRLDGNHPPVFSGDVPAQATVGQPYQHQILSTDLDEDQINHDLVDEPLGATISSTGLIDWTPTSDQIGTQTFTITLSDGNGGTNQRAFSVRVIETNAANRPPEIVSEAVPEIEPGGSYAYLVLAADPDPGDNLTYQLLDGPSGAVMTDNTVEWQASATSGWYDFVVEVSDLGGLFDLQRFSVLVDGDAPLINTADWGGPKATAPDTIEVTAHVAADASGPIQFQFEQDGVPGNWQDSSLCVAQGLLPNTSHAFRVRLRDRAVVPSESAWSELVTVYTLADTPPAPLLLSANRDTLSIELSQGMNPSGTRLALRNASTEGWIDVDGLPSVEAIWADAAVWDTLSVEGLTADTTYHLCCKAKNEDGIQTEFGPILAATTDTHDSQLNLTSDRIWLYENEPDSDKSRVMLSAEFVNDPYGNTDYTYEWEVYSHPTTGHSLALLSGGGSTDGSATYVAPEASEDHPTSYLVSCRVTGSQTGNSALSTLSIEVRRMLPSDFDSDEDVDADDLAALESCASAPGVPRSAGCEGRDLDNDDDVDQTDFAVFQRCYSGANVMADPNCGN